MPPDGWFGVRSRGDATSGALRTNEAKRRGPARIGRPQMRSELVHAPGACIAKVSYHRGYRAATRAPPGGAGSDGWRGPDALPLPAQCDERIRVEAAPLGGVVP